MKKLQKVRADVEKALRAGESVNRVANRYGLSWLVVKQVSVKLGLQGKSQSMDGGRKINGKKSAAQEERAVENHIAYAFGHTEAWLETYATAAGISGPALASGVAELLHRKACGRLLGTLNRVPQLRRAPAKGTGIR